jgi:hypothetical protein
MRIVLIVFLSVVFLQLSAQVPDRVYANNIHSVKLNKYGDPYGYPILFLNSGDQLELHFDDMDGGIKNYYYGYQLCNADWTPANIQSFDYIRGFQSTRITTYRNSSISFTRYTHYQANLPERNSIPTRSGNYLLKVFLNNDTSNLILTKRMLVVDNKVSVAAQILQPFSSQLFRTGQRVQVVVSTANARITSISPQDLKLTVLQNNIWPTAAHVERPTIFRGNYYEYSDDALSFPAGREWRWVDLRSLRLLSDRMAKIVDTSNRTEIFLKPDIERKQQIYVYYRDLNGVYTMENSDGNNPFWQSDYAWVHFTYVPRGGLAYGGKDIYVFGELNNYTTDESSKMVYNSEKGVYEKTLYLKQGYYNYSYVTKDANDAQKGRISFDNTEGDYNNSENNYTVLVYFRPFGARADELIGYAQLNTLTNR